MKRTQKIIFIVFLLIACFSAYSLAEVNQSHKIDFKWYKNNTFTNANRVSAQEWTSSHYPSYMNFDVITNSNKLVTVNGSSTVKYIDLPSIDYHNNFLIFTTFGEVLKKGYNINIEEISQRGNVIEILINMGKPQMHEYIPYDKNYPYDIVKVSKDKLTYKGNLLFIFKDHKGNELFRKTCYID